MDTLEAIRDRRSIRAFLPRPVPREVIAELLEATRWAPSGCNRQQWRVTVATGEVCRALAESLVERTRANGPVAPCSGSPESEELVAEFAREADQLGKSLWEYVVLGSAGFYGAPVVAVVSDRGSGGNDVPPFVTTMLLAAHSLGLGTCWLGYPLGHADVIRQALDIPEGERLRAVVALGYPDLDSPANGFRSPRDEVETFVRWVGFD